MQKAKKINFAPIFNNFSRINMAIIELEEMEFYAYHGCFNEEQIVGNRFMVNVELTTNIDKPALTDNIIDAVNYVNIYAIIKEQIEIKSHLLENVASRMVNSILNRYSPIEIVKLKISKLNPPMGGQMKQVSVTLTRKQ